MPGKSEGDGQRLPLRPGQAMQPLARATRILAEDGTVVVGPAELGAESVQTMRGTASELAASDPEVLLGALRGDGGGDRYLLDEEIGRGGMGVVLRALDRDIRRHVAMKVVETEDPSLRARFILEAQISGQLQHPGIAPVYEVGVTPDGHLFFTMKLVKGRTLTEVLGDFHRTRRIPGAPPLSYSSLLECFLKVCDAVAFAHSRGVVHRDLKPDNIMIGDFGEVLVMDWGVARVLDGADLPVLVPVRGVDGPVVPVDADPHPRVPITEAPAAPPTGSGTPGSSGLSVHGAIIGTPSYMPPEQADPDRTGEVDERSDIYALGAILYEILCGRAPFVGSTTAAILAEVISGELPPPPEEVIRNRRRGPAVIPRELSGVASKALSKRKADRYSSVLELEEDVRAYLDDRELGAVDYNTLQLLWKLARRNRNRLALMVVAFLGIFGVVGVLMWAQAERTAMASQSIEEQQIALDSQRRSLATLREAALDLERERTRLANRRASFEVYIGAVEPLVMRGDHALLTSPELAGTDVRALLEPGTAAERSYQGYPRWHLVCGRFHHRLFEHGRARRSYETAIQLATEQGRHALADLARYHLAFLEMEVDPETPLPARAQTLLDDIDAERSPGPHHALACALEFFRATAGGSLESLANAEAECTAGLAGDPTFADLHYWRAVLLTREFALRLHRSENRRIVVDSNLNYSIGLVSRDWKLAEASLRTCLSLDPGHERARRSMAIGLVMQGRVQEGIAQLVSLAASMPDAPVICFDLAYACIFSFDIDEAMKVVLPAAERFPKEWNFGALLAAMHLMRGEREQAIARAREAWPVMLASQHDEVLGPSQRLVLPATTFIAEYQLDRIEDAHATWAELLALMRQASVESPMQRTMQQLLDAGPMLEPVIRTFPSLTSPPALERPPSEILRLQQGFAMANQFLQSDPGKMAEGLAGPITKPSFLQLTYFTLSYRVLSELDMVGLRKRREFDGMGLPPGVLSEFMLLLTAPYAAALYADGRLAMPDSLAGRRLTSSAYLLGAPELATQVADRLLTEHSDDGAVHYQRAYLSAVAGDDSVAVLGRLRTARALGYDLSTHAEERVFRSYRKADPAFAALFAAKKPQGSE